MKLKFTSLIFAATIFFTLSLHAQEKHVFQNMHDPLLLQFIKEKKEVHFIINQTASGPEVQFYESHYNVNSNSILNKRAAENESIQQTAASNFHLTKDINVQTDANPANSDYISAKPFAVLNNVMYFSADDGVHGKELWRSDGTAAGTYLVEDIEPGIYSSTPSEIITVGQKLYFVTQNSVLLTGKIWISDGTAAGTTKLLDVGYNGPGVNGSYYLTDVSGIVYFLSGSSYYAQVWKTNGTVQGTVFVKDLSSFGQSPILSATANGLYYFTLFSNTSGRELWRSNGTDAGTFMVKDISNTTDYFYGPFQLTPFNNKLYFSADDGSGRKLWFTDGTAGGTQKANQTADLILSTNFSDEFVNNPFAAQQNNLYLSASATSTGTELYKYNTGNGFSLVKDITPGKNGGLIYNITAAGNFIAFVYQDTVKKKNQLWATTLFPDKTFLIKSYNNYAAFFSDLTFNNQLLYFISNTPEFGNELWKTSGTPATTMLVKDIYAGTTSALPLYLTSFNNALYFNAASKKSGNELWKTDGTGVNTIMVKEINATSTASSGLGYFGNAVFGGFAGSAIQNTLYFTATKPETGFELYESDGTNAGTDLSKDLYPGEFGSMPLNFTSKNRAVYFIAYVPDSNNYSRNIFKTDSAGNTVQLTAVPNGYINVYSVADNGNVFYVFFPEGSSVSQLWRSNGTVTGNVLLNDSVSSYPVYLKTVNNKAFFTAISPKHGNELWTSDGTKAGTHLVKDLYPGINSSNPYSLYAYNNNIVFGANNASGTFLWISDGTSTGTKKLKEVAPYNVLFNGLDYNNFFCVANNELYMNAATVDKGAELWKTDGSTAGTKLVKDIASGIDNANPSYLTNVNGSLFFVVFNQQLWKSDGKSEGTQLIQDLGGTSYYAFDERCVADNKLFFNKDQLLWVSDGTNTGTHQVIDNGLAGVSAVTNLAVAGNSIFFNGYTNKYGYELYAGDATKVNTAFAVKNVNIKQPLFTATVLQNPVTSALSIKIQADKIQTINIIISNERGNTIAGEKIVVHKGSNIIKINSSAWYSGVYIVNLANNTGDKISLQVLK